jgi:hypothetical protein
MVETPSVFSPRFKSKIAHGRVPEPAGSPQSSFARSWPIDALYCGVSVGPTVVPVVVNLPSHTFP